MRKTKVKAREPGASGSTLGSAPFPWTVQETGRTRTCAQSLKERGRALTRTATPRSSRGARGWLRRRSPGPPPSLAHPHSDGGGGPASPSGVRTPRLRRTPTPTPAQEPGPSPWVDAAPGHRSGLPRRWLAAWSRRRLTPSAQPRPWEGAWGCWGEGRLPAPSHSPPTMTPLKAFQREPGDVTAKAFTHTEPR